jgi:hypothetical protein
VVRSLTELGLRFEALGSLFGDFLALLTCLRKSDSYGLFAALHLAASSSGPTFSGAPLVAVHFAFDVAASAPRVFELSLLRH